ncbi:MAG: 4-hydroxy-tetrahydrodipicolinate reductase [Clostridia bacterium]|nr:4-hydroxy-tetrahydrodipicolinate reductase [Clostridia bacterium]
MKILIHGIMGHMGREVLRLCECGYHGATGAIGVDRSGKIPEVECYTSLDEATGADVIIDFSHHTAIKDLCAYAIKTKTPLVVATTGHDESELDAIRAAAEEIPVFFSANMSLGVALLVELAKTAARAMPDAEIEIIEKHHNRKLDAPSGTALMVANEIKKVRPKSTFTLGRSGMAKRVPGEIGIHAIRMGNIVGEHEVIVGTDTQTITLKHEAHSRALFAEGAIVAAEFLVKQPKGLYAMQDIIKF